MSIFSLRSQRRSTPPTPARIRRHLLRGAALVAAFTAATLTGSFGSADAVVNTSGAPTHTYLLSGTNCSALVGAVKTNTGAAMGGVDVTCRSAHKITARVIEYRWNGRSWQGWSSATYTYNTSYLSIHTPGICGGGGAYWYTAAYVTVDGVSWGPLNSNSVGSWWAPPNC